MAYAELTRNHRTAGNPGALLLLLLCLCNGLHPTAGNQGPSLRMEVTLKTFSGSLTDYYRCDAEGNLDPDKCGYQLSVEAFSDGTSLGSPVVFDKNTYQDEIHFDQNRQERGYKNPITFQIREHPRDSIAVLVTMQYYSGAGDNRSLLFRGNPSKIPMAAYDDKDDLTVSGSDGSSRVAISVKLICNEHFYGHKCERWCKSTKSEQYCDSKGDLKCKIPGSCAEIDGTPTTENPTTIPTSTKMTTMTRSSSITSISISGTTSTTAPSTSLTAASPTTTQNPPDIRQLLIVILAASAVVLLVATVIGFSVCLGIRCATSGKQPQQPPEPGNGKSSAGSVVSYDGSTIQSTRPYYGFPKHAGDPNLYCVDVPPGIYRGSTDLFRTSPGLRVLTPPPQTTTLTDYCPRHIPGGSGSGSCICSSGTFAVACDIPEDDMPRYIGGKPDGEERPPLTVSPGAGYPASVTLPGTHQGTLPGYRPPAQFESSTTQRGKQNLVAVRSFQV